MDLKSLPWYGQFLVFLLIGGIAFGLFYMLHYSDVESQIDSTNKQIENLQSEIKKAEKKEAQLPQIREELAVKQKLLENLKEILPETQEVSQIVRKIQAILLAARLRIQSWTSQSHRKRKVYDEVPFQITLDGNYHNLGIFFDQVAKLKKIFTINNLSIKPLPKATGTFTIKASFTASTYTYREADANAPAARASRGRRSSGGENNENI